MNMQVLVISFVCAIVGCSGPDSEGEHNPNGPDSTDGGMKYVIVADDCNLQLQHDSLSKEQLVGSWIDSLLWFPSDSCFVGAKPIERITHIDFYSNGRYKFMETYPDTSLNYVEEGEYWTYTKNDSCSLALAEWYGDRPIQHGDTLIIHEWLIYSFAPGKLKLRSGYHQNLNPNLHEFKSVE